MPREGGGVHPDEQLMIDESRAHVEARERRKRELEATPESFERAFSMLKIVGRAFAQTEMSDQIAERNKEMDRKVLVDALTSIENLKEAIDGALKH